MSDAVGKSWKSKYDLALICVFLAIGALLTGAFHVLQYRWDSLRPAFDIKKYFDEELEKLSPGEQKSFSMEKGQFARLAISDESDVTITVTADDEDDDLFATLGRYEADDFRWFRARHLNDDFGGGKNPKIETRLPRGEYLLGVESFDKIEKPIRFSVRADVAVVAVETNTSRGGPAGGGER